MGRQFNYYITPEQSDDFLKYAVEQGFMIFVNHAFRENEEIEYDSDISKIEFYKTIEEFWKVQELHSRSVFLYREEYGALVAHENGKWDMMRSTCIEYVRNYILEQYGLARGRIYLPTFYAEEKASLDIAMKDFQKLVRAMRKRMDYSNYTFSNGRTTGFAVSQEAVNLVESGCGLYL